MFAFLSVDDIVGKGLNTVSWLISRIINEKHQAFRALWAKPPRVIPLIYIKLVPSSRSPIVRIQNAETAGENWPALALPNIAPTENEIIGIGNVKMMFPAAKYDEDNEPTAEEGENEETEQISTAERRAQLKVYSFFNQILRFKKFDFRNVIINNKKKEK
jgi:hypothetical protein